MRQSLAGGAGHRAGAGNDGAVRGHPRRRRRANPSRSPALPLPTPAHNLPPDPTPFIGREPELAQIAERLADPACRLLTILGPGGMGKTRLAIQAARSEADRFAHGACFVDLAPIASAEQLAETILRALQVPSQGATEPDQQVMNYLADKQMLLVLDNYEHLLTGPEPDRRDGYGLVTKMLGAAPRVKLLVTSRARLNVRAEWLAPLEGLGLPEDLEHEGANGAVQRCGRRSRSAKDAKLIFASILRCFAKLRGSSRLRNPARCSRTLQRDRALPRLRPPRAARLSTGVGRCPPHRSHLPAAGGQPARHRAGGRVDSGAAAGADRARVGARPRFPGDDDARRAAAPSQHDGRV